MVLIEHLLLCSQNILFVLSVALRSCTFVSILFLFICFCFCLLFLCLVLLLALFMFIWSYYPEPTRSFVVVNERWKSDPAAVFGDLGVQVVTGHRFLGGFIGSPKERDEYVMFKVDRWVRHIDVLSEAATS